MAAKPKTVQRSQRGKVPGAEALELDAEAVRYWRLQRGFTQEALAEQRALVDGQQQSISYAQIRRIEADGRCGPGTARVLAGLLGVELGQLSPRDGRHLPCGLPREPSVDFVGREAEIMRVRSALQDRGSVRIAASIEGLPGIGKTELALQICGLCERERSFRIFWIDAHRADLTPLWADVVAPHLAIDAQDSRQRASAAIRVIESLAEPVLLVLDNVEDWSASRPWPRPRGRHIRWLVTTRRGDLGGREFHHVDLPVLDRSASEQLLLRICGPEIAERPGFHALLDLLGGYTIAIELAASFMRRFPDVDPGEYRAELERGLGDSLESEVGERSAYGQTLERALSLLWERLPPKTRRYWLLAASFAQAPASSALSGGCGLDRRALAELRDFHLIETPSARRWSMHRLVRAFGRARGDGEARNAFYRACCDRAAEIDGASAFETYKLDRSHLEAALEDGSDRGEPSPADLAFWERVAVGRLLLGEYASARDLLERTLVHAEATGVPDYEFLARVCASLGEALWASGELERARALLVPALESGVRILGVDHLHVIELRRALGKALLDLGEHGPARDMHERVLASRRARFGEEHASVAEAKSDLGILLARQGEFDSAQSLLEEALEWARCHVGESHRAVPLWQHNLAWCLLERGDLAGARRLLEESLELGLRILGELHPEMAAVQNALARVLYLMGDLGEAKALHERCVEVRQNLFGGGNPRVAFAQNDLACCLMDLGELLEAERTFELAMEVGEDQLGEDHPHVFACRGNLASLLLKLGAFARAEELSQRALLSCARSLGEEHPSTAAMRRKLAGALRGQGRLGEARDLIERSLASSLPLGESHAQVIYARADLGRVQHDLGTLEEARESLNLARESALRSWGEEHRAVSSIGCDLASVLCDLGDWKSARALLERGLEVEVKSQRAEGAAALLLRARLAALLHGRSDLSRARSHAREALRLALLQPEGAVVRTQVEELCGPILESPGSLDA